MIFFSQCVSYVLFCRQFKSYCILGVLACLERVSVKPGSPKHIGTFMQCRRVLSARVCLVGVPELSQSGPRCKGLRQVFTIKNSKKTKILIKKIKKTKLH